MASLRKNVASQNITFALVNATSGAALVGATVSGFKSIDGGAQAGVGGSFSSLGGGQYLFAPTQADTNGTSVGYLFTATNAIPVNMQFFTDNWDTTSAGVVVATNNDKTGYSLSQSFPSNFSSLAITVGGAVTVGTNNDKTGYSLTQSFPSNFASLAITAGGAVTVGTNNDKSGYSLTQTFPANFSSLAIDGSGNVSITDSIKKNTAVSGFMFMMTDSTTHAPKTGLTVTATRSLDGAAFAACANSVTEMTNGFYQINLANTDTNGNKVMLRFTATGADDLGIELITQP